MSESEFIIPIDKPIDDFLGHLEANPRTILSSKFGDGKSYFLNALKQNETAKEKYEFLTLYPVNYQVAENRDIFELIKADMLFQLFIHNMMSDRVIIPKDVALSFYIQDNNASLVAKLLPFIAEVALTPDESKTVLLAMKGAKLFKDIKKKFDGFCAQYDDDSHLEKFMEQVDKNFLYESDIVTYLIKKAILDYRTRTKKKVVLVIEDLDRIDPAHLFRILNVFSAHMDASYRYGVKPNGILVGNKFDLDNVVMVVDYGNARHIFHHFYGDDSDFNGYISKFTSSTPFFYSLSENRQQFIKQEVIRVTNASEKMIDLLLPAKLFDDKTIRDVKHSFDISKQFKKKPVYNYQQYSVALNDSLLRVMALMYRLKIPEEEIQRSCLLLYKKSELDFYSYAAPYAFLMRECNPSGLVAEMHLCDEHGHYHKNIISLNPGTGKAKHDTTYMSYVVKGTDLIQLGTVMLNFIRK